MKQALIALAAVAIVSTTATAGAGDHVGFRGWGPRLGISSGPDQVHFGAHLDFGNFAEHFRLQPNVEVGVGSDRTIATFNLETSYRFLSTWGRWSPYLGGGLGLDFVGGSNGVLEGSDSEIGANVLGGIERGLRNGDRFFLETKLGLTQAPDVKVTVGWTFY